MAVVAQVDTGADRRAVHRRALWTGVLIVLAVPPLLLAGFLTWLHFHDGVVIGKDYLRGGYETPPPPKQGFGIKPSKPFWYSQAEVPSAGPQGMRTVRYYFFGVNSGVYYLIWVQGGASESWPPKAQSGPFFTAPGSALLD